MARARYAILETSPFVVAVSFKVKLTEVVCCSVLIVLWKMSNIDAADSEELDGLV